MTETIAKPISREAVRATRKPDLEKSSALKVLAVIDGSERTGHVLRYLQQMHIGGRPIAVVLVNVQPRPQEGRIRGYGWFKREEIRDRLYDAGTRMIASAGRQLDGAGIPHTDHIEIGSADEIILRQARDEQCGLIVVPEPRPGFIRRWLLQNFRISFGSTASILVQFAQVPVVVAR